MDSLGNDNKGYIDDGIPTGPSYPHRQHQQQNEGGVGDTADRGMAKLSYDDLLQHLGEFGRYQRFQYFLVCLVSITSSLHSLNMVFVGPTPDHRCSLQDPPPQWRNLSSQQMDLLTYPLEKQDNEDDFSSCKMYNVSDIDWTSGDYSEWSNASRTIIKCPDGWTYSTQYYDSTIVSQWDLVCDKADQRGLASTIFFAGRMIGAFSVGIFADKFGRRPVFFVSLLLQVIIGCVAAMSPYLWFFYVFYFLQGVIQVAVYLSSFVLGTEMVGPSYRKVAGTCVNYFYAIGQILLTGLAYGIRQWRYIEIAISVPVIFFLIYYWFLPESVRYLMAQGKLEEANKILQKTAQVNKVTLPDNLLCRLESGKDEKSGGKSYTLLDIFKTWKFAKIAINVWFNWFVNAMVYYGLSLNSSKLHGDPYLNFLLLVLVEFPALTVALLLLDRIGRRRLLVGLMVIGGLACIGTAFVPEDMKWLSITLSMLGKFAITGSYNTIYLMAAEVFPTVVRTAGMGMSSVFARVGGMIAPQFLILGDFFAGFPVLVFGGMSIIAGVLALALPEPMGQPLPQDFGETDRGPDDKQNTKELDTLANDQMKETNAAAV